MNTDNSEAIGALARIGFDFNHQARQLLERARYHEQCYKTATNALWTGQILRGQHVLRGQHAEFFRLRAINSYQQAHRLTTEAHRLKRRYILCIEGIDRLNASIPLAPAAAGDD
jgi:hypothetical protein